MTKGLRVLDLSRIIAGPYAAMLLGDLGADVIKVERPGRGDDCAGSGRQGHEPHLRRVQPQQARRRHRPSASRRRQRVAFELARRADVIIENFVPGVAAKLGLGYEAVRAVNPTVVYASVSGSGRRGPTRGGPATTPSPWA